MIIDFSKFDFKLGSIGALLLATIPFIPNPTLQIIVGALGTYLNGVATPNIKGDELRQQLKQDVLYAIKIDRDKK